MEKLQYIIDKLVETHSVTDKELVTLLKALKDSADPDLMDGLDVLVEDDNEKNRLRVIRTDLFNSIDSLYKKLVEKPKDEPKK